MQASLIAKLEQMVERREEVARELADPGAAEDAERFRRLSQEYAQLSPVAEAYAGFRAAQNTVDSLRQMRGEEDPELRELAELEWPQTVNQLEVLENQLRGFLVPRDPLDDSNVFLELRAGTGGDEAAIFAGDLLRMYLRYAETQGWHVEVLSENAGEHGGYKEIITRVVGFGAYARLKYESGVHRVQRVPQTETQGRIHTSAATVAVLPEVAEEQITINPAELRIDTYRSSGAGGQHVNKTESAIRITHLPSGLVVECQEERSQHKNRAKAMALLQARLVDAQQTRAAQDMASQRRRLVGSGDRSERIRTYNFPQGRITDHRINLTLYQLDRVLEGELDALIEPLLAEAQAEYLSALGAETGSDA